MKRFTVRPKVWYGESLTGYIMRVAQANSIDFDLMLKNFTGTSKTERIQKRDIARLDILTHTVTDSTVMCNMLGLNSSDLDNLTFTNMFRKFLEDIDLCNINTKNIIKSDFVRYSRRFCPKCLKENGYYKRIWQVSEVSMCIEHKIKLTDECPHCLSKQSYYHPNLAEFRCVNCNKLFYDNFEENMYEEEEVPVVQLRINGDWEFLLSKEKKLPMGLNNFSNQKTLAIKMLYLSRKEKETKTTSYKFLDQRYVSRLIMYINDDSKATYVTLVTLLKQLRKLDIELKDFFEMQVPVSFINTIKPICQNDTVLGPCLSVWCDSYNCNDNMIEVKGYHFHTEKYRRASVCKNCLVPYGYNRKTDQWEEIEEYVKLFWKDIRPKLERCLPKSTICKELNIGRDKLNKAIGFLANQGLLSGNAMNTYVNIIVPEKIEEYFENLMNMEGSLIHKASKVYGWGNSEFYYFFFNRQVQNYLIFQEQVPRRKREKRKSWNIKVKQSLEKHLLNNIDISVKNICIDTGCSVPILQKEKLTGDIQCKKKLQQEKRLKAQEQFFKEKVKELLFDKAKIDDRKIYCESIYEHIGMSISMMCKTMPNMVKWIKENVVKFNIEQKRREEERLIKEIKYTITELYKNEDEITIKLVAEHLGIKPYVIKQNNILKEVFYENCGYVKNE